MAIESIIYGARNSPEIKEALERPGNKALVTISDEGDVSIGPGADATELKLKMQVFCMDEHFGAADKQARKIAYELREFLANTYQKSNLAFIVTCEHGEIRSACVAAALMFTTGLDENLEEAVSGQGIFEARTMGFIHDAIEDFIQNDPR